MKRALLELLAILVLAVIAIGLLHRVVGAILILIFFALVIKLLVRLLR